MTTGRSRTTGWCVAALVTSALLGACNSAPQAPAMPAAPESAQAQALPSTDKAGLLDAIGNLGNKALESVGLKQPAPPELPQVPDSALPDWPVSLKLHASDALNVTPSGQSLAVLVRVYRLKSPDAFLQAPLGVFGDAGKEKEAFGEDLLGAREIQLVPGQRHASTEKVARDGRFLGVVALFRKPAEGRWRYAFSTPKAAWSGLHVGVHACAMSVQVGEPLGTSAPAARSVAVPCP
ncbi:type VI secretion system lipoprotein TssJ [uncultured Aquabacterium sp.]|jgi:type VI secretion system protein VasD|uniref:type VI secretion system lipoprotein TssJ n=1 Tax=uncultured Aquabacterium sp. TaxID=158753 RepID=UPI00261CC889|nr:type VI secretion system lipoprotein TssJ [uncultured Aquabacterium sp.]